MLFDSFEAYDVQETRRISRAEGKAEGKAEDILELLSELGAVPKDIQDAVMETQDLERQPPKPAVSKNSARKRACKVSLLNKRKK